MKYNSYSGVIYDSIYYSVIHFNKEAVTSKLNLYVKKESDILLYYDEFRKGRNIIEPPESLYPFFFCCVKTPCVMTEYFRQRFDFFSGTFTDFYNKIKDISAFKRFVFFYYLEQFRKDINIEKLLKGDNVEAGKALVALRSHGERANTFVKMFFNFEELTYELLSYFEKLVHKMSSFHSKKRGFSKEAINKFCEKDNLNIFRKNFDINPSVKFSRQTFSVCFMHHYVIIHKHKDNSSDLSFVLGCDSESVALPEANYKHVTHASASKIFANDIINDIIKALTKEDLTITQLYQRVNVSRPTADRLVNVLNEELAIQISRKNGNEKYYKLNPEYFLAAKYASIENLDKIISDYKRET